MLYIKEQSGLPFIGFGVVVTLSMTSCMMSSGSSSEGLFCQIMIKDLKQILCLICCSSYDTLLPFPCHVMTAINSRVMGLSPTLGTNCHKGVVFWIICIMFMHRVLLINSPAMERTLIMKLFPFTLFGKYNLQKMSVQFAP